MVGVNKISRGNTRVTQVNFYPTRKETNKKNKKNKKSINIKIKSSNYFLDKNINNINNKSFYISLIALNTVFTCVTCVWFLGVFVI